MRLHAHLIGSFFNLDIIEMLREHKRNLDRSIREIDRERTGLQNQEKKIIVEMKKLAKQGQMVNNLL